MNIGVTGVMICSTFEKKLNSFVSHLSGRLIKSCDTGAGFKKHGNSIKSDQAQVIGDSFTELLKFCNKSGALLTTENVKGGKIQSVPDKREAKS